jgi:hypothetical protein
MPLSGVVESVAGNAATMQLAQCQYLLSTSSNDRRTAMTNALNGYP